MLKSISLSIFLSLLLSSTAFAAGYVNDEPPDYNRIPLNEGEGSVLQSGLPTQGDMGDSLYALDPLNRKKHDSPETPWSLVTPPVDGPNETDPTKVTLGRRNMMGAPNSEGQPILKQARGGQLMQAGLGLLSAPGYNLSNLPPTVFNSFVKEAKKAGGLDELIYGDEGRLDTNYLPPYFFFTRDHRIARGNLPDMLGTGHGSLLEEAWGYGPETSLSGPTYRSPSDD